ncbi:MAG: serine hydrolase domain-containing protein [bacterium]|jgi:CubicO group peptidase (beta-lactamase class C family)|nr:serine hydrolase domain-containing protein [bacterium]
MKKSIVILFLGLTFFFVSCGENKKANDESGTPDEEVSDAEVDEDGLTNDEDAADESFSPFIDALKKDLEKSDALGVSVAVMKGGNVVFAHAFGFKDAGRKVPLTPETLMQIGSTTKQMTATALLQKVEEEKVALENTINDVLPDLEFKLDETWDDSITVHHLLSHQGGFYDWIPWDFMPEDDMLEGIGSTYAKKYFLMNPPGAFYNYSNPNFAFAGLITETLDNRFWPDIMKEDVFAPLGMERTFLRRSEVKKDGDYSDSYGYDYNEIESAEFTDITIDKIADSAFTRPAGLVWTTPLQMMKWADFIMNGNSDVLGDKYRKMITTPHVDTLYGAGTMHYGYGMMVETGYMDKAGKWYEIPVWEHGGNTISFSNILYILPDQDFAVSICSSGYGTDFTESLDVAITTLANLPEPSETVPKYETDPEKFDDHVGTYNDAYNVGTMIITRNGDKLLVSAPTLEEYNYEVGPELVPVSSDIFFLYLDGQPLDITFVKEEGHSKYMRNRIFVLTKVEEEETLITPTSQQIENFILRSKRKLLP